ncbi:PKD domain-containing protein [Nitrospira sp. M1]
MNCRISFLSTFLKLGSVLQAFFGILAFLFLMNAFLLCSAEAADVTLAWDPPNSEYGGFILEYGTASGQYTQFQNVGTETMWTVRNLEAGQRYYFAAKTYDATNTTNSQYSNEISVLIPLPPLVADFFATPTTGTAPLTISFTDSSVGTPTSWIWNFGDGETSRERHPTHIYKTTGTYSVSLTVGNAGRQNVKTFSNFISVGNKQRHPPSASFTMTPSLGRAPLLVTVDAAGSRDPDGAIVGYAWDFGDGRTGTGSSLTHIYETPGTYAITLIVTDIDGLTATATQSVTVNNAPGIRSDDFHGDTLDTSVWTFINSLGDVALTMTGKEVAFAIPGPTSHAMGVDSPTGNHAARIMQPAPDTDFEVEVKFVSPVTARYHTQGIVVEEDSGTYLRLEFFSDGARTHIYASSIKGPKETTKIHQRISARSPAPLYMRVKRTGQEWTQSYSTDGSAWTVAGRFKQAVRVSAIGPYAGNIGLSGKPAPSHTGVIDYFVNTDSPIASDEKDTYRLSLSSVGNGTIHKVPDQETYLEGATVKLTAVPAPDWTFGMWGGAATSSQSPITVTMTADQSISATFTRILYPPSASFTATPSVGRAPLLVTVDAAGSRDPDGAIVGYAWDFGDGRTGTGSSLTHIYETPGTYAITLIVTDIDGLTATATQSVTVNNAPGIRSDDFHGDTLDTSVWTFINSLGDVALTMTGKEVAFAIPGPTSHAMGVDSPTGNHAARIMQPAPDTDFEVEVKFVSPVTARYHTQGIVVEEDSGTYLRLEFFSDGARTHIYASSIKGPKETTKIHQRISARSPAPLYMRVKRTGQEWTQSYSTDGSAWTVAGRFKQAVRVSAIGPYAGNIGLSGKPAPSHTGVIDYFVNTDSPIASDDGESKR